MKSIISPFSNVKLSNLTPLALIAKEVHVWLAMLNFSDQELAEFFALLSANEQARALRFHFPKDYQRFVAARGILRKLLGRYVNCKPQAIEFTYGSHGKPMLANDPTIQFNVSHSQNVALYAFSNQYEVGIDIEAKDKLRKVEAIAQRFFSTQESAVIKNLSGDSKAEAFFNGWTRKEAFLKALGKGLSYPLKQVEVTMDPKEPAKFLALDDPDLKIDDWSLYDLKPLPEFAAALVVKGTPNKIHTWRWCN